MAKPKTNSKTKEEPTKTKSNKKRRPKERIDRVRERGKMLAGIAGVIIALQILHAFTSLSLTLISKP